jgi:hypothetical protein
VNVWISMKRNPIFYILLGIVIVFVIFPLFLFTLTGDLSKAITFQSHLNNLLYKTDHQALLAGCRSLIDEGYQGQYIYNWPDRDPNVDNFPGIIAQLKPTYVWIHDDGCVMVEMWGGMSHYGIRAYAEDFNQPRENYYYGDKKLIEGLWLYSDFVDLSKVDLDKRNDDER